METSNQTKSPSNNEMQILSRIAVLEDRTDDSKKSWLDRLKEYGGFIALVITIGYSFPLGVWDRFVVSAEQRENAQINELKAALSESLQLLAETGQAVAAIGVPELRDTVSRAGATRLLLIMSKHEEEFRKRIETFSPPELISIGLNYQYTYQPKKSIEFFEEAIRRSPKGSITYVEAARQIAKTYFAPSSLQNIKNARNQYKNITRNIEGSRNLRLIGQEITIRAEWALFEMTLGDWACGQAQYEKAFELQRTWQKFINDQGNMMRLLKNQFASITKAPEQPVDGCD